MASVKTTHHQHAIHGPHAFSAASLVFQCASMPALLWLPVLPRCSRPLWRVLILLCDLLPPSSCPHAHLAPLHRYLAVIFRILPRPVKKGCSGVDGGSLVYCHISGRLCDEQGAERLSRAHGPELRCAHVQTRLSRVRSVPFSSESHIGSTRSLSRAPHKASRSTSLAASASFSIKPRFSRSLDPALPRLVPRFPRVPALSCSGSRFAWCRRWGRTHILR